MSEISKSKMLLTCLLGIIATIGIARFAYTPMIPVMAAEVELTEAVSGYLATANYAGYLCGAFWISFIANLRLKAQLYKLGLLISVITTAAMGMTTSELVWYFLRFLSGLSSATGMLLGAGLLMHWLMKHKYTAVLGHFFSGLGIGIVITAITAKLIEDHLPWEVQWQVYAVISFALIISVFFWLPDFSEEQPITRLVKKRSSHPNAFMPVLQIAYFCAGFGYVISATFLIAIAESMPELKGHGWLVWLVVGFSCAPASSFWDQVSGKTDPWTALLAAYTLKAISLILIITSQSLPAVLISSVLYGASFIGIVSMMLSMVGRLFPENPSKPMSRLTFSYGTAQMLAPAMIGYMAGYYGNYTNGLILTLIVVITGSAFLIVARYLEEKHNKEISVH